MMAAVGKLAVIYGMVLCSAVSVAIVWDNECSKDSQQIDGFHFDFGEFGARDLTLILLDPVFVQWNHPLCELHLWMSGLVCTNRRPLRNEEILECLQVQNYTRCEERILFLNIEMWQCSILRDTNKDKSWCDTTKHVVFMFYPDNIMIWWHIEWKW